MIFSQYTETCEVLIGYPRIGGGGIKGFVKKAIMNILHANIDVQSRRLMDEFPVDVIKCIKKFQSHFANMTFADKSIYDSIFQQVTHKGGESAREFLSTVRQLSYDGSNNCNIVIVQ